jgi:hypothetical protein
MKTNKNFTNPLFWGKAIVEVFGKATSAIYALWLTSFSTSGYTATHLFSSLLGIITVILINNGAINNRLEKRFGSNMSNMSYNNFTKFLFVEGLVNFIVAIITYLTGTPLFAMVLSVFMSPFGTIQSLGVNEMMSKYFNTLDERRDFDNFYTKTEPVLGIIGFAIGWVADSVLNGVMAFAILSFVEIINNFFFFKAYKTVQNKPFETEDITNEDEADEEDAEAATDAA